MSVPIYTSYLEVSADNYKIHGQTKQFAESKQLLYFIYKNAIYWKHETFISSSGFQFIITSNNWHPPYRS